MVLRSQLVELDPRQRDKHACQAVRGTPTPQSRKRRILRRLVRLVVVCHARTPDQEPVREDPTKLCEQAGGGKRDRKGAHRPDRASRDESKRDSTKQEENPRSVCDIEPPRPNVETELVQLLERELALLRIFGAPEIDVFGRNCVLTSPERALDGRDEGHTAGEQRYERGARPAKVFRRRDDEPDEGEAESGKERSGNRPGVLDSRGKAVRKRLIPVRRRESPQVGKGGSMPGSGGLSGSASSGQGGSVPGFGGPGIG